MAEAVKLVLCLKSCKELIIGLPGGSASKEPACQCTRHRFDAWVGKIPWRRKWRPAPVLLPGKSHGQRSLGVYSAWDHSDTTEHAHNTTQHGRGYHLADYSAESFTCYKERYGAINIMISDVPTSTLSFWCWRKL